MCGSKNFRRVHLHVCMDGGGSPPGQTDSRRNSEKNLRWGVILILPYGSESGCCYPPECLQFQNIMFQFLPRHHHFPLLDRL